MGDQGNGGRRDVLMLVDGNSIVNRAYYAFAGQSRLITKAGFPTHAVFGFLNIYFKYFDEVKPTRVCVAFDLRAPTFRHLEYEGYKAGRKGMPDDLAIQLPVLKEVIDALGLRRAECEGFEADDILGTLSKSAEDQGIETVIVTGDRDSLQLVSPLTRVLLPVTRAGQTRTENYDEAAMLEKYGVTPTLFIDVKGLMGDSSDNIPGVAGIGEKTATELVRTHGGLDSIYADLEAVERKAVREKLAAGKEMAYLSRRLATIVRDAPCGTELSDTQLRAPNRAELYRLFKELQFSSYLTKMGLTELDSAQAGGAVTDSGGAGDSGTTANPGAPDADLSAAPGQADTARAFAPESEPRPTQDRPAGEGPRLVCDAAALAEMAAELCAAGEFVFYPLFDKPDRFTTALFAAAIDCPRGAYYIEIETAPATASGGVPLAELIAALRPLIADASVHKTGHDVKQIYHFWLQNGEECPVFGFDTMLGAYVADAASGKYELAELAAAYLSRELVTVESLMGKGRTKKTLAELTPTERAGAMAAGAAAIRDLRPVLAAVITDNGQDDLYYNIELPLAEVLAAMEVKGFCVDTDGLRRFSTELDAKISELTSEIYALAGEEFNINSTKQLGVILYEKLGLKPVKKTKSGYSTDIDALDDLADKHEIIGKIVEYRQHVKLKSTYADGLAELVNPYTRRIHTTMNQAVTATGRISSTEPNLQNIPVRLALGREIRRLFVPQNENWLLLGADYSQIELRVLAHISEDSGLSGAFREGLDIHASTAARVFGVPESEVTPEMRTRAKAVNFGIVYGIGDFSLARDIGVSRKEAREYIDSYLGKYDGVKRYMADAVEEGRRRGYAVTIMNRRRSLPELRSPNYNMRSFGERVAMNTPVQGSAADIIQIAMVRVHKELKRRGLRSALILQVHDELIVEAHEDELVEAAELLRESMEGAVALSVPLIADVYCGRNWKEIKNPIVRPGSAAASGEAPAAAPSALFAAPSTQPAAPRVIGLTGASGSGKSLAAKALADLGAAVIDADQVAREAAEDAGVLAELVAAFGPWVVRADGTFDRTRVAERAFSDRLFLDRLTEITHRYITTEIAARVHAFKNAAVSPGASVSAPTSAARPAAAPVIVIDAPLPVEKGFLDLADAVWVVTSPLELRRARVVARDHITAEQADARFSAQMQEADYLKLADIVIVNDGGPAELRDKVRQNFAAFTRQAPPISS
ncbi:MAG: DNA polymerase I [Clostridiales bacterium]|nr:DNA polymerase I [Clostridiales bacterium]